MEGSAVRIMGSYFFVVVFILRTAKGSFAFTKENRLRTYRASKSFFFFEVLKKKRLTQNS